MELIFPFKNITTNKLLDFVNDRENIHDFILTKQERYPYSENYFLKRVEYFRNSLPNFENEILQTISTTNQATIDSYFNELIDNVKHIRDKISLNNITLTVKKWNEESLKKFEETIEMETEEYFKSENRKRKHLEEYEDLDYGGILGLAFGGEAKKIKRTNYNFYCVDKQPELIDENFIRDYREFLVGLTKEYMEIAKRYGIPYSKGEITSKVEKTIFNKPVVFVEGEHDITYIVRASELIGYSELLSKVELRQRGGWRNLDKIWDAYKDNNWETVPQKKLLLYDCDIKKEDDERGNVYRRIIKTIPENIISKGIENLFPNSIIEKAMQAKSAFVDITKVIRTKRGSTSEEITYIVNDDEKKNICQWICKNGTAEDFSKFKVVFDLIRLVE